VGLFAKLTYYFDTRDSPAPLIGISHGFHGKAYPPVSKMAGKSPINGVFKGDMSIAMLDHWRVPYY
jgi:hypothetical protein